VATSVSDLLYPCYFTLLLRRSWSLARTSLNVKVKGQRSMSSRTKNEKLSSHPHDNVL